MSELNGEIAETLFPQGLIPQGIRFVPTGFTWPPGAWTRCWSSSTSALRDGARIELLEQAPTAISGEAFQAAHHIAKADLIERINADCLAGFDPSLPLIGFARRMTGYKRANLIFEPERLKALAKRFGGRKFGVLWACTPKTPRDMAAPTGSRSRRIGRRQPASGRAVQLLHASGSHAHGWGRHLAEQPGSPAGSERHKWHEGLPPGRAQPQHSRWLVGGRLRTQCERLGLRGSVNLETGEWPEPPARNDEADAESLYQILEKTVLPVITATDRSAWAAICKGAIASSATYASRRMVHDYVERIY